MSAAISKNAHLLEGNLWTGILAFAVPIALTGMLQHLFNAADLAIVGRYAGKEAMAAVGCNIPAVNLLVGLFVGLGMGVNVVVSHLTGAGNKEGVKSAVHTAIPAAFLLGLLIGCAACFFADPLLGLMAVSDDVFEGAKSYFVIFFSGLPFVALCNVMSAIFVSRGETVKPLVCLVAGGTANVALNVLFVCGMGMNVDGVALATVIANGLSALLMFAWLMRRNDDARVSPGCFKIVGSDLAKIVRIGLPSAVQGMVFSLSNICVQAGINSLGADVVAASAAAFNVEIFHYFVLISFAQACTTYVGQNSGAGNRARCFDAIRTCMILDAIVIAGTCFFVLIFGRELIGIFNSEPAIADIGMVRLYYIVTPELVNVPMEVLSGALRGFGYASVPAAICMISICGTRILWLLLVFPGRRNYETLMVCYPISWIIATIGITVSYFWLKPRLGIKRSV